MLASHFGYVSLLQEMGMIVPEWTGGVAPLRHEVELARYREGQTACRELAPVVADDPGIAWGTIVTLRP